MRFCSGTRAHLGRVLPPFSERGLLQAILYLAEPTMHLVAQGRSVHTYNMLVETRHVCNPVKSSNSVYSDLDNKLIYLSGKLATSAPVADNQYGVSGNTSK